MRINKYCAILFLLLMLELNCFGFVDKYGLYILGVGYFDIVFFIKILVIGLSIILNIQVFQRRKILLDILPIGAIVISITSAVAGNLSSGQPIFSGLWAQREWLSSILLYYPIRIWLEKGKLNYKKIIETLFFASSIYLVICIVQYILIDYVKFLSVSTSSERYGDVRLVFNTILPIVTSAFCLATLLSEGSGKKEKRICVVIIACTIILAAFVTKGRMRTLSFIAGMAICALIRRGSIKKKAFSIGVIVLGCFFLMSSPIGQDILDVLWGSGTGLSADTLTIRDAESVYYLSKIFESLNSFVFGCGYPNSSWAPAVALSTPTVGNWTYYTTDIGIIGDFYYYGIVGLIWFIAIYLMMLYQGIQIYKKTRNTAFIQIVIVDLIGAMTLVPLLFSTTLVMPLLVALMESLRLDNQTNYNYSYNSLAVERSQKA